MTLKSTVEKGQLFDDGQTQLLIVEANPFHDAFDRTSLMVGYKILDGRYASPVAHFWMRSGESIEQMASRILGEYRKFQKVILGGESQPERPLKVIRPKQEKKIEQEPYPYTDPKEARLRYLHTYKTINTLCPLAFKILEKAREIDGIALMGKNPRGLKASAIYIAGLLTNNPITQNEIAEVVNMTDVTIRFRYQQLAQILGLDLDRPYPSYLHGFKNQSAFLKSLRKERK